MGECLGSLLPRSEQGGNWELLRESCERAKKNSRVIGHGMSIVAAVACVLDVRLELWSWRANGVAAGDSVHGAGEPVAAFGGCQAVRGVDHRVEVVDDDVAGVEHVVAEAEVNAHVARAGSQVPLAEGGDDGLVVAACLGSSSLEVLRRQPRRNSARRRSARSLR